MENNSSIKLPTSLFNNKPYNHLETISKLSTDPTKVNDPPVIIEKPEGMKLEKKIITKRDLRSFHTSSTYGELLNFVIQLSLDCQGKSLKNDLPLTNNVKLLLELLEKLNQFVRDIPPKPIRTRFGNESFVEWIDLIEREAPKILFNLLNNKAIDEPIEQEIPLYYQEISGYLTHSFGDKSRIDYGSGHELNFICFLFCLVKIGFLKREEYQLLVLKVFFGYLNLMRVLQENYWLEPAGSHGVWGLDDYHFLPFLFGSSQLIEHKYIRPKSIRNDEIINSSFAEEYMYLGCIHFINKVKTGGSLLEHSPMLVDISGVKNWSKVNEGMIKMYKQEVLNKLPIMQHLLFGSILPYIDNPDVKEEPSELAERKPIVTHSFSSCGCISRVPSVFAVANTDKIIASTNSTTDNNTPHSHNHSNECDSTDHSHHNHNHTHNPKPNYFPLD
ncbi:hypothetical protein DICPUDRAFT_56445 [Dictyostelium purpureum]|uniref:Serine/threonine-protein phosphatase 2A activator n=1 Tax=Dictyostelium purpureum TaxID=5786 RepID=F0ZRK5_DICPU|nr:uncharacterized protein DICPUDRAFT_56445 [Dictyostelium purpureum]EGC33423.1 hypothetical protein DICPUDRAFT_56445 [Dictyostelium purpureum]|eukprot:XP_003290042.1 hypothetical protein DICPUDRAFT_56445 [Dictyostelium purpureum]